MRKHLFNIFVVASLLMSSITLNSCSEYTEGDPNALSQGPGSVQIKILTGKDKDKIYTNTGIGTVIGTKRSTTNEFVAYQILGQYQNIHFSAHVDKESGTTTFIEGRINFTDITTKLLFDSTDDANGTIKITDIQLLQKYDQVGAQMMNGKLVFKGKFNKESIITTEVLEEDILIEGTITF